MLESPNEKLWATKHLFLFIKAVLTHTWAIVMETGGQQINSNNMSGYFSLRLWLLEWGLDVSAN